MLNKITVIKEPLAPSQEKHSILPNQFVWRVEKRFVGENSIVVADNQEAIWWQRPLTSEILCKIEADGCYSYNLPFWQKEKSHLAFKTDYNVLLNKNSVPIAIHIQTDETWTPEQKQLLPKLLANCLYDTLLDLGVDETSLTYNGNDVYFSGRKFACSEQIIEDTVFSQNTIITILAQPEKELFDRLTGRYAHVKTITGIGEEVPSITKEAFINTLYEKLQKYVEEHFN
jgi:hypothetical protein